MFPKIKNKYLLIGILTISLLSLSILSGSSALEAQEKQGIEEQFLGLYNTSQTLEDYYEVLCARYNQSLLDYQSLHDQYTTVMQENIQLQGRLEDSKNITLSMVLEDQKNLVLKPGENNTLTYEIPDSGVVELNYNSTQEIYLWIGSTVTPDVYYCRYPSFPNTAAEANLSVPASPDLLVFISNPSSAESELVLDIFFTY